MLFCGTNACKESCTLSNEGKLACDSKMASEFEFYPLFKESKFAQEPEIFAAFSKWQHEFQNSGFKPTPLESGTPLIMTIVNMLEADWPDVKTITLNNARVLLLLPAQTARAMLLDQQAPPFQFRRLLWPCKVYNYTPSMLLQETKTESEATKKKEKKSKKKLEPTQIIPLSDETLYVQYLYMFGRVATDLYFSSGQLPLPLRYALMVATCAVQKFGNVMFKLDKFTKEETKLFSLWATDKGTTYATPKAGQFICPSPYSTLVPHYTEDYHDWPVCGEDEAWAQCNAQSQVSINTNKVVLNEWEALDCVDSNSFVLTFIWLGQKLVSLLFPSNDMPYLSRVWRTAFIVTRWLNASAISSRQVAALIRVLLILAQAKKLLIINSFSPHFVGKNDFEFNTTLVDTFGINLTTDQGVLLITDLRPGEIISICLGDVKYWKSQEVSLLFKEHKFISTDGSHLSVQFIGEDTSGFCASHEALPLHFLEGEELEEYGELGIGDEAVQSLEFEEEKELFHPMEEQQEEPVISLGPLSQEEKLMMEAIESETPYETPVVEEILQELERPINKEIWRKCLLRESHTRASEDDIKQIHTLNRQAQKLCPSKNIPQFRRKKITSADAARYKAYYQRIIDRCEKS